jgi:hypothetical protein
MKSIVFAAAVLVSGVALANDVDPNGFEKEHFQSSASRAEVIAELKAAQAKGLLPQGELGVKVVEQASTRSRAEVAAEARASAHRYGEVADIE